VSGEARALFLKPWGASVHLRTPKRDGVHRAAAAARHRLVVFSPGFPPSTPGWRSRRAGGCECLAELDLAALEWGGRIVAVTGTNGKRP